MRSSAQKIQLQDLKHCIEWRFDEKVFCLADAAFDPSAPMTLDAMPGASRHRLCRRTAVSSAYLPGRPPL
ncbi:hypothetical protein MES5069_680064 [Mesorhizobium escarrei]|uniref:Uncharacterized protein n=1 Tax=Mesorhizobium escarrei TaxID=666018 RepID=A0ABN8KHT9_9HYPH|nr:hypothetical protein MES5069_680064 [Mesorhizobium escarrei]